MEVIEFVQAEWQAGPERPLYDREELYTGTAARGILMDLPLPLDAYRFMPYGSGSQLLSVALAPLYAVFGPHYLVLKLAALAVTLLGGLFWFLLARRWLGERAAWLFGLLYLFAPTILTRTALIAKGDHPELMAAAGAIAYLATRAVQAKSARAKMVCAASCGLLSGLSVYVGYTALPILGGAGLIAVVFSRLHPRRAWLAFAAALLVGLFPWILFVLRSSGSALQVYGMAPGSASAGQALQRLQGLIELGLFSQYDLPGIWRRVAALVWLAAVLIGWARLAMSWRRPFPAAVLAGTAAHLASFCLFAPDASSRYLVPVYPLLLLAVVHAAHRRGDEDAAGEARDEDPDASRARRRAGASGRIAWAAVVLLGFLSQSAAIADARYLGLHPPLAGTDWPLFGEVVGLKLTPAEVTACPPAVQRHLAVGLGLRAVATVKPSQWVEAARLAGPENEARVWEGIGIALAEKARFQEAAETLPRLPPELRRAMLAGLAEYADFFFALVAVRWGLPGMDALLASFQPEDREPLRAALARAFAVLSAHDLRLPPGVPASVPVATGSPGGATGQNALRLIAARESQAELERRTGREELLRGAGYALYRSMQPGSGLRLWRPPRESWLAPLYEQARAARHGSDAPRGSAAFWQGAAEAFERDLSIRSPAWFSGPSAGDRLARLLARTVAGLSEEVAGFFYEAAGRAAAAASRDPLHGRTVPAKPVLSSTPPARSDRFDRGWVSALEARLPSGPASF